MFKKIFTALVILLPVSAGAVCKNCDKDLDKELNIVYKSLVKKNPDYKDAIVKSQRDWLNYVSSTCELDQSLNCTTSSSCWQSNAGICEDDLTKTRIIDIKNWLKYTQ